MGMEITIRSPFRFGRGGGEAVLGSEFEQLVDRLHGKHYQDAKAGRVFSQTTTPLGLAIPIYTSTAPIGNVLWNPTGSGVNVELINYNAARVSGVTVKSAAGLMSRKVAQSAIATGAQITAFAEVTPINGLLGSGEVSKVKSSNAGTVTITAGVAAEYIRNLFSIQPTVDATAVDEVVREFDFDGTIIVPPGVIIWVASVVATVALYAQTLTWKETPL